MNNFINLRNIRNIGPGQFTAELYFMEVPMLFVVNGDFQVQYSPYAGFESAVNDLEDLLLSSKEKMNLREYILQLYNQQADTDFYKKLHNDMKENIIVSVEGSYYYAINLGIPINDVPYEKLAVILNKITKTLKPGQIILNPMRASK